MKQINRLKLFFGALGVLSLGVLHAQVPVGFNTPLNIVDVSSTRCISSMKPTAFAADTAWTYPAPLGRNVSSGDYLASYCEPLVADLNGDGKPEIIALGYSSFSIANKIVILDGNAGKLKKIIGYAGTTTSGATADFPVFDTRVYYHGSPSFMAIGKIAGEQYPCIILATGSNSGGTSQAGFLYCYQITDANLNYTVKWKLTGNQRFNINYSKENPTNTTAVSMCSSPMPHIADFNSDGKPEILVYNKIFDMATGALVATTEPDVNTANVGRRWWETHEYEEYHSVMAVADFDGDGKVEIAAGNKVYSPKLNGDGSFQGSCDIIKYDFQSMMTGLNTAQQQYYGDGFTGVGDVNGDGKLDVIVFGARPDHDNNYIRIFAWTPDLSAKTGTLIGAQRFYCNANHYCGYSMPFIGDINGKITGGKTLPEICLVTGYANGENAATWTPRIFPGASSNLTGANIVNTSGDGNIYGLTYDDAEANIENKLKISFLMKHDDSSQGTGITVFDFNNSGTVKIVYRGISTLRVLDASVTDYIPLTATTPAQGVLMSVPARSNTAYEYCVVADVNGDNSADFITVNEAGQGDGRIYVYSGKGAGFAGAPPVWNQGQYYPTLVNKDLSIPSSPIPLLTTFQKCDADGVSNCKTITPYNGTLLQQALVRSDNYYPAILTPDLVISNLKITAQTASSTTISFKVKNKVDAGSSVSSLAPITIYKGASIATGTQIITYTYQESTSAISGAIYPGDEVTATYTLTGDLRGQKLWVRLTDDGTVFPAAGYYECMVTDNDTTVSSVIATNDVIAINRGEYKALDILTNDFKPCSNTDVKIIIVSQTNNNLLRVALNGNRNALTGMAGATNGSSVISYKIVCGTDTSNVATATVTVSGSDPAAATANWVGAVDSDWNNTANWSPAGRPNYNSNVVIPAYSGLTGVKAYPSLNYSDFATCNTVYFGNGAEVGKPVYLTYNKAKVQLKLMSNRWNMVAPPLKDMYTGDYILGNGQYRHDPARVLQKEYQSANINSGTAVSAGSWSTPVKTLDAKFPFGSALAVWLDYADEPTTATSKMMNDAEAFVFPSDSTYFCSYGLRGTSEAQQVTGAYATPRTAYSARFVYDKLPAELAPADTIINMPVANDASFQTVIIPNPMMSHIDYVSLQADNADKLGTAFKIVNSTPAGDAYEAYEIVAGALVGTQGGAMASGFKIPPMQSFIADKFTQSAAFTSLTFNPRVSVTAPTISLRSSTTDPEAGLDLFRVQLNSEGGVRNSGILIIKSEGASNKFVRNEDAFTTFPDNSTAAAIIYAITDNGSPTGVATSINQIGDLTEPVELGIRCKDAGTYSIVFSDLAKFAKASTEIWLEDKATRDESGNSVFRNVTAAPNYEFTTSDKIVEGRFFVHFKRAATGIHDIQSESSSIRIYASKNVVTVASPSDDQIQSVQVVNVQGQTIISRSGVNTDYMTLTLPEGGNVYVVKVTTQKAQNSRKVVIK